MTDSQLCLAHIKALQKALAARAPKATPYRDTFTIEPEFRGGGAGPNSLFTCVVEVSGDTTALALTLLPSAANLDVDIYISQALKAPRTVEEVKAVFAGGPIKSTRMKRGTTAHENSAASRAG